MVHSILVPGTGPAPSPEASSGYGADLPAPGITQSRDSEDVTLVRVDWNAGCHAVDEAGDTVMLCDEGLTRPADANRYVALLVLYRATQDGASYNPFNWSMVDLDGFAYDQTFFGEKPALSSSNDLPSGRKAQGWITFEVPKAVHELEVIESQFGGDYLRWLAREPTK